MVLDPQIFEVSYWLSTAPGLISSKTALLFLVLFLGVCSGGVFITFYSKKKSGLEKAYLSLYRRVSNMLITMGLLGLLWLFFAYENIVFFSGRYFFVAWVLGMIVYAYLIYNDAVYEVPKRIQRRAEQLRMKKYMPSSR